MAFSGGLMPDMSAYYSVIQYCPDRSRAEAANVGVLLYVPGRGYLKARLSAGNDRVRRFFEGTDVESINASKKSFQARIQRASDEITSVSDLEHFIASRANDFLLTAPRPMRVSTDFDGELGVLFR